MMQVREAAQPDSHRPARPTPHTPLITTEQPAIEQPATERPATEQPAADPALFEDPQVTAAAVAEATGGSAAAAQRGKRARQQPARFGEADMELSAAQRRAFDRSSGTRHERQPERPCVCAGCVTDRAERDELKRKLEAETTRRAARYASPPFPS